MPDIRSVTKSFAVSPQISVDDVAAVASTGFRLIINNRPDDEAPGQPTSAEIETAADAVGLSYVHIPMRGLPTPEQVAACDEAVRKADGPVLAFCRSGTRSITIWALAQASTKSLTRDELIRLGAQAGYDLTGALGD